jgi:hypothetical protein
VFSHLKISLKTRVLRCRASGKRLFQIYPGAWKRLDRKELGVMVDSPLYNTNKQKCAYMHMCICLQMSFKFPLFSWSRVQYV